MSFLYYIVSRPPPGYRPKPFERNFLSNPQVYVTGYGYVEIRPGETMEIEDCTITRMSDGSLVTGSNVKISWKHGICMGLGVLLLAILIYYFWF